MAINMKGPLQDIDQRPFGNQDVHYGYKSDAMRFRAYSKKFGGILVYDTEDEYDIDVVNNTLWLDGRCDQECIITQSINQRDGHRDAILIYHGDLVQWGKRIAQVVRDTTGYCLYSPDPNGIVPFNPFSNPVWTHTKVVGNIFLNPEMELYRDR